MADPPYLDVVYPLITAGGMPRLLEAFPSFDWNATVPESAHGFNYLNTACVHNHMAVVEALVEHGADLKRCVGGYTPLMCSIWYVTSPSATV